MHHGSQNLTAGRTSPTRQSFGDHRGFCLIIGTAGTLMQRASLKTQWRSCPMGSYGILWDKIFRVLESIRSSLGANLVLAAVGWPTHRWRQRRRWSAQRALEALHRGGLGSFDANFRCKVPQLNTVLQQLHVRWCWNCLMRGNEREIFLVEGCFLLKDENLVFLGEVGSRVGWSKVEPFEGVGLLMSPLGKRCTTLYDNIWSTH